jgi:hypothetical protein
MGKWKYKITFRFDVERAAEDLDEGRITLKEAQDEIESVLNLAAGKFPATEEGEEHAEKFREFSEMIGYQDTVDGVDSIINDVYDYADDNRIWLDDERKGPLDWRPR